ncbi:MAG: 50S ribosomal protein L4 [Verrucomicrobiota bacterium]
MERTVPVVDKTGKQVGTFELPAASLEAERGGQAVHETVVAHLAECRAGTASTKTRAEVRGGGAKPYRQKGTGRARAGTIRSPLWGGGGVVFGPKPRSYAKKVNSKVRKLAFRRILHDRVQDEELIAVDALQFDAPRTKDMVALLHAVGAGENTLVVVESADENLLRSIRNLPNAEVMTLEDLNAYALMRRRKVVFTQAALEAFSTHIAATKRAEVANDE